MDGLIKKLKELSNLIKALKPVVPKAPMAPVVAPLPKIPEIKPIQPSSIVPKTTQSTKIPGVTPKDKKDPKKVAQQLKSGKAQVQPMLKFNTGGQWSLEKADDDRTDKVSPSESATQIKSFSTVNAKIHGWGYNHNNSDQEDLIHGLDTANTKPLGKGVSGARVATSSNHPQRVILKSASNHPNRVERGHVGSNAINSSKREVVFHNMAHNFFDMGKYVPTTGGFSMHGEDYSGQKRVPRASHVELESSAVKDPIHEKAIGDISKSGELHKIALMDNIMGNHDRHKDNYMIDKSGQMHLIDNGTAFDYVNFDPKTISHFHNIARDKAIKNMGNDDNDLHPGAKAWLLNLDIKKAAEQFANQSHAQDMPHVKGFMTRLKFLQDSLRGERNYTNVEDLLKQSRESSGPMHEHHKEKAA